MKEYIEREAAIDALREAENHAFNSYYNGLVRAHHIIADLPSAQLEQQWILCSERLPEDDIEVFVYLFDRQNPYIAWVCDCHWYTEDFEVEKENYPVAWMPLPESYREEGRE